jgi:hypothetical protein
MEKMGNKYKMLVGKHEGRRILGISRRRWRIILKWLIKERECWMWTGFIWLRIGSGGGLFQTL